MISAVIPVYNGELYLAEAISSVLNQTSPVAEIIVIDDGSEDRTAEVARKFGDKVRYYLQSRAGAGAARNLGVEKAAGDLIAFLDADDLWLPEKTALQLASLSADQTCEAVFGGVEEFFSPELNMPVEAESRLRRNGSAGYLPSALLLRKSAFERTSPFVTGLKVGEFIEWYGRAQEQGLRTGKVPEIVIKRRIHRSNTGIREQSSRNDYARVLKGVLDRRRKA
jgi:glycosyltransferase involved in cell wall biosynthesis